MSRPCTPELCVGIVNLQRSVVVIESSCETSSVCQRRSFREQSCPFTHRAVCRQRMSELHSQRRPTWSQFHTPRAYKRGPCRRPKRIETPCGSAAIPRFRDLGGLVVHLCGLTNEAFDHVIAVALHDCVAMMCMGTSSHLSMACSRACFAHCASSEHIRLGIAGLAFQDASLIRHRRLPQNLRRSADITVATLSRPASEP